MIFLINRFTLKDQWFDSHRLPKSNRYEVENIDLKWKKIGPHLKMFMQNGQKSCHKTPKFSSGLIYLFYICKISKVFFLPWKNESNPRTFVFWKVSFIRFWRFLSQNLSFIKFSFSLKWIKIKSNRVFSISFQNEHEVTLRVILFLLLTKL